jgi:hypothetical protein
VVFWSIRAFSCTLSMVYYNRVYAYKFNSRNWHSSFGNRNKYRKTILSGKQSCISKTPVSTKTPLKLPVMRSITSRKKHRRHPVNYSEIKKKVSLELLFSSQNLPICSDKKTPHNMN